MSDSTPGSRANLLLLVGSLVVSFLLVELTVQDHLAARRKFGGNVAFDAAQNERPDALAQPDCGFAAQSPEGG